MEVYQPGRERTVLDHVRRVNEGPLADVAVIRLFERIIDESRRLERLRERKRPGRVMRRRTGAGEAPAGKCREQEQVSWWSSCRNGRPKTRSNTSSPRSSNATSTWHRSTGALKTVLGAVGGNREFDAGLIEVMDGVQQVLRITEPYKLASRTFKPTPTVVSLGSFRIGGDEVIVMAGPCSAETEEQVEAAAASVAGAGAKMLRGGAFKPRSSPYSFQGLGEEGLRMLRGACDRPPPQAGDGGDGRQPSWIWWAATPICCRWVPATCRTTPSCESSGGRGRLSS